MDYSLSIFQGILSTEGTFLNLYLEGLDEQRKFSVQSNDGASLMQQISSLLTTASTRALGLRLLDKFIDNCSSDVLQKKGNLWTTLVLKALNNQELRCDDSLIFQILTKIIKRSQQVPDLAKSFASIHISKVYESLTNVSLSKSKYALSCIETCLRTYPGSSGPSRGIIERFLWKNLDHLNSEVVKNCGKCLHLLQQVKGGGVQGVNHKMQWKNYQLQLLGGIHDVYNEMFANCIEMYEDKIEQEHLPWGSQQIEFDPEPVKKAAQMYTRCRNLLTYLIIALREPFPVEKPILLKKILYIIIRGLSVNVLMLEQNPCAENIALTILLPKLHGDLLNLLNVVFLILRGHLRPYSERILGLIVDSLKWTSTKNVHGEQQILQNLRKQIYDTVSLWCKIFCSGSRCETIAEYLFQEILSDITPSQSEFTLKVLSGSRKHMSKKARRQLHNAQNEKSNMAKNHSNDSSRKEHFAEKRNQELCTSALRCLQEILFSAANFLKPTILKMMQTSITQIAAIFFELSLKPTHLYSNNICRVEIYNVLYALLTTTHHLCPPPTDLALTILQTAYTRDVSLKVRIRCGFILQNLEKVIHPQKESLLFTIEARDIRNTFIKMGQENLLSEFNVSNLLSNNANEDDSIDEPSETTILQYRNLENLGMENIDKTHSNSNIIIENRGKINNKTTDVADIIDEKSHKVQVTDVNITIEDQVDEHNEIFLKDTLASDKNIDSQSDSQELVLRVDDDVDIAAIEDKEKCIYSDSNIDEPKAKKPKNYEHNEVQDKTEDEKLDSETDEAKNSNQIINMDQNEEDLLAEIASQFVDELD